MSGKPIPIHYIDNTQLYTPNANTKFYSVYTQKKLNTLPNIGDPTGNITIPTFHGGIKDPNKNRVWCHSESNKKH